MRRRFALLAVLFGLCASFRFDKVPPADAVMILYRKADSLYNLVDAADATNTKALALFNDLISRLSSSAFPKKDSILFHCFVHKGVLLDVQTNYPAALESYREAIKIHEKGNVGTDSLLFPVYAYTGACLYNLNDFAGANDILSKAEAIIARYPKLKEKERIYNTLGALYYDKGNYLQSKNYFSHALDIIQAKKPLDTISSVVIQINIATSLFRLEKYDSAISIYKRILPFKLSTDYIYMNMGRAYAGLNQFNEALACYRKVNTHELPMVSNEMGIAFLSLQKRDSAAFHLQAFSSSIKGVKQNPLDVGINAMYRAILLQDEGKHNDALQNAQEAVIHLSNHFNDTALSSNPQNFIGSFAYYRLFEALLLKAELCRKMWMSTYDKRWLQWALNTYQSAVSLIGYIEKSYDTDDARLLLKKKSHVAYEGALETALELYKQTQQQSFLEEAFLIGEKNKASVMALNLMQNNVGGKSLPESKLLQEERNIKYNIARLDIASEQSAEKDIEKTEREKAGYEMQLAAIQKKLEENSSFYKAKYDDAYPGFAQLKTQLNKEQALISFYASGNSLHAFVITKDSVHYLEIAAWDTIQQLVSKWLAALQQTESGRRFDAWVTGKALYSGLIAPMLPLLSGKNDWIFVPDGMLYFLPFESLPIDKNNTPLLEMTAISYRFSTQFIEQQNQSALSVYKVLGLAPFALRGTDEENKLPSSLNEVSHLDGLLFTDSNATKRNFIQSLSLYPIIHLATHAVSDPQNAATSFIAFYPQQKNRFEDNLYLEELYGMNLRSAKLVIISACESGNGNLVYHEGVMSLARAFAYAGCESVVNSLWKADDRSTATILTSFHKYLQQGYDKSNALRRAKLDYIHNNTVYTTPNYWAHLIITGNTTALNKKTHPWLWLGLAFLALLVLLYFRGKHGKMKKVDE